MYLNQVCNLQVKLSYQTIEYIFKVQVSPTVATVVGRLTNWPH